MLWPLAEHARAKSGYKEDNKVHKVRKSLSFVLTFSCMIIKRTKCFLSVGLRNINDRATVVTSTVVSYKCMCVLV